MPLPSSSRFAAVRPGRTCVHLILAAALALLAGCATRTPAPVVERTPPKPAPVVVVPAPAPAPVAPAAAESEPLPQTYTVKRGDTLHQIALDHGLDYRELAAWNNIENPNVIRVGRVLRISAPPEPGETAGASPAMATAAPGVTVAPLRTTPPVVAGEARPATTASAGPRNTETYKTQPKAIKEPYSEQALRDVERLASATAAPGAAAPVAAGAVAAAGTATAAATAGGAPGSTSSAVAPPPGAGAGSSGAPSASAPGGAGSPPTVVARADTKLEPRGDTKPAAAPGGEDVGPKVDWQWPATGKVIAGFSDSANLKGIDIAGKAGQPVVASAAGKVVYAGSGLRGYGKLVIVKHNATYLSAYAHNSDILVKEGQEVTRGQKIAEMGNTDSDQVKLHFEIRRHGKPVDPLKYLPPV